MKQNSKVWKILQSWR